MALMGSIGLAGSFSGFKVELELKGKAPGSSRTVEYAIDNLYQRWATGREVKVRLYREDLVDAVELTIETRGLADDETDRDGTYQVTIHSPGTGKRHKAVTLRGRAVCSVG